DLLIERAYEPAHSPLQNLVPFVKDGEQVETKMKRAVDGVQYLKLHGCIDHYSDTENPLILTREQYARYSKNRTRLFDRMQDWGREFPIIFCGYSVSDPHIQSILYELFELGQARPMYFIVDPSVSSREERYWAAHRVTIIPTTFEVFIRQLDGSVSKQSRALPKMIGGGTSTLRSHYKVAHATESDGLQYFLSEDVDHVRKGMPVASANAKEFYRGAETGWGPIAQDFDVIRGATDSLVVEAILSTEEERAAKVELFAVDARGGRIGRWLEERAGYASAQLAVTNLPASASFKWISEVPDSDEINAHRYRQRLVDAGVDTFRAPQGGAVEPGQRILQFRPQTDSVDSMLSYSRWAPWHAVLNGYGGIAMGLAFGTVSQSVPLPALQPDGSEAKWFSGLEGTIAALRRGFDTVIQTSTLDDFQRVSEDLFAEKRKSEKSDFNGEQMAFRYSKARILAFLAAPGSGKKTQRIDLKFKKSLHVYDMLGEESISRNGKFRLDLSPGDVGLISILPYPVTRLHVQAPERIYAGRRLTISVDVKTRDALPGDHVVRVDFGRRGRAPLKHYSRNLICVDGRGTTYMPLAMNEIPGSYTLRVRDVLTGVETVKTIQVLSLRSEATIALSGV
ncbi:MAG: SIR2 family protein, partial [Candidatus Hydrogenedentes bacterium]|nr:SIR2 family protein [Candidatus Hydrogenedentota bacterium]